MVLVVLGRRGCGKTTQVKARLAVHSRVIIFDPLDEYSDVAERVTSAEEFLSYLEDNKDGLFRVAYSPYDLDPETAFDVMARAVWAVGDCLFVIDEVDIISTVHVQPEGLLKTIRYGRHRNISVIVAARRAADVPRAVTSQADEIASFRQSEPRDIQYLTDYCGREYADRAKGLPRYQWVRFHGWEQEAGDFPTLDSRDLPMVQSEATEAESPASS